jgi:ring-1,2-phenylacetyl-CoA epoxidase subunit PaaC
MRHFLFDQADQLRFEMLANSSYEPLAKVARKVKGEIKYHVFHANTWVVKLGAANEESHTRMQKALNDSWNYALGIFEPSAFEEELIDSGVFDGEQVLFDRWLANITPHLLKAGLSLPSQDTWEPVYGGRVGKHTAHLSPLVEEMSEVFKIDPSAEW